MKKIPNEILGMIILGTLFSIIFRSWDHLPFVINSRMKNNIVITEANFDEQKNINLQIRNNNFNDISDIALKCDVLGKSGSKISDISFKAYVIVQSSEIASVKEQISIDTIQGSSLVCVVDDFTKLESHKKQSIVDGSDLTVGQLQKK